MSVFDDIEEQYENKINKLTDEVAALKAENAEISGLPDKSAIEQLESIAKEVSEERKLKPAYMDCKHDVLTLMDSLEKGTDDAG